MLDIRPPDSAFLVALGDRGGGARVTPPGAAPIDGVEFIELQPRSELENVADVSLLDVMTVLAFPVVQVGRVPVGTRIDIPPTSSNGLGGTWTVRRVYGERDTPNGLTGFVLVGVA
jgi:hypothetical protein